MFAPIIAGIALFLIGMVLLTEGARAAAGDALRRTLLRLAGGPLRAFASGAAMTVLIQSSSATTVATIGFVSAGLLTFPQAIGIVIGASVGTTSTGWLVATLGLHVSISALAIPLLVAGAFLRLLTRGRPAAIGFAIAGFGLLFLGIASLQTGMREVAGTFDLTQYSAATLRGRLLLLGVGLAMTVVMQSSSAAIAATLTALHVGAIALPQAAVLVIGQNIGTSATAALAAIGGSTPAKRTALAHVLFHLFSGALAFGLLFVLLPLAARLAPLSATAAPLLIAAFHTSFNLLGAAIVLPLARRFAHVVQRLIPGRGPELIEHLDRSVAFVPAVAVEAARLTAMETASVLGAATAEIVTDRAAVHQFGRELDSVDQALFETRRFLGRVRSSPEEPADYGRHVGVLHAVDHLERMIDRVRRPPPSTSLARSTAVRDGAGLLVDGIGATAPRLQEQSDELVAAAQQTFAAIVAARRAERPRMLERTAAGQVDPDAALESLDAIRWIERVAYHWWRALYHLVTPARAESAAVQAAAEQAERAAAAITDG